MRLLTEGSFAALAAALSCLAGGCADDERDGKHGAGDAAAAMHDSGADVSSPARDEPGTCNQSCQDYEVMRALYFEVLSLLGSVVGTTTGELDLEGPCDGGGKVHITGTHTVANDGVETAHMTFVLTACTTASEWLRLTLDGTLQVDGDSKTDDGDHNYFRELKVISDELEIAGQFLDYDRPTVAQICAVSITEHDWDAGRPRLSGEICDRSFDELTFMEQDAPPPDDHF